MIDLYNIDDAFLILNNCNEVSIRKIECCMQYKMKKESVTQFLQFGFKMVVV